MSLAPVLILPYVPGPALSEPYGQESVDVPRASRSLKKWLPDFVISEDWKTHELTFEIPVSVGNRELATLEFLEGIRQKEVADARWFHEVKSIYPEQEIGAAEQILSARSRGGSLWEEAKLRKQIEHELRSAVPDPIELDRWEESLRQLIPFAQVAREFESSHSELLALVVTIKRLKALYAKAQGWKSKAQRQAVCAVFGQQWDSGCGRSFFRRFRCRNRYCPQCGPYVHQTLVAKYLRMEKAVAEFLAGHPSYRLRVLDITAKKRGERMPSPEDVRRFKADVKKLIDRINHHIAEKFGLLYSKQLTGYLYCLEFGFENNNLHCHGALLSPFIEQEWLSEQWREIRDDGSFKVWIAEATSFEAVIIHALEYTGKFAAPSAERAFELEKAFAGCRRVDGLGWLFNRLPKEDDECDLRCPCGEPGCVLKPNRELGWLPLAYFGEHGIRDLDEIRERGKSPPRGKNGGLWIVN
jgi:hypothetical protein